MVESATAEGKWSVQPKKAPWPRRVHAAALFVWLIAGVVPFLPFAFDTSAWDAVTLRVPENQGNWWHALVGAPFFLAYPMIWLRLRLLFARNPTTEIGRRLLAIVFSASIVGTILVETPFLLHLAGTRGWPRFSILSLGLGIIAVSTLILMMRRRYMAPPQVSIAGMETAYLANAALCLVVYSNASGSAWSRCGWTVTMIIVWPIGLELAGLLTSAFFAQTPQSNL